MKDESLKNILTYRFIKNYVTYKRNNVSFLYKTHRSTELLIK